MVSLKFSGLLSFISFFSILSYSRTMADNPAHELKEEWTTPLKVGDTVPDVSFMTRVRIESDDENPFDWKGKI